MSTCLVLNGDVHHDEDVVTGLGLGPDVQLHDPEGDAGTHALFWKRGKVWGEMRRVWIMRMDCKGMDNAGGWIVIK